MNMLSKAGRLAALAFTPVALSAGSANGAEFPKAPSPTFPSGNPVTTLVREDQRAASLPPPIFVAQATPRQVAQGDNNRQQPPSNNVRREGPNSQPSSQKRDAITILQEHNQTVIDGQRRSAGKFKNLPRLPGS